MEERDLDKLKAAIAKAEKLNSDIVNKSVELDKSMKMVTLLEKEKKFKEDLTKAADAKNYQALFDLLDVVLELGMPETVAEVKRGMDIRTKIEEVTKKLESAVEGEGDASTASLDNIKALLNTAMEMELGGKFDVLGKAEEFLKSVEALRSDLKAAVAAQAVPKAIELMTKAQAMKMDGEVIESAEVLCGTAKEVMETLRTVLLVSDMPALPPLDENGRPPALEEGEEAPQLLDVLGLEKSLGDAKRLKLDEGYMAEEGEEGGGESPGETITKAAAVMEKVSKVIEKLEKYLKEAGVSAEAGDFFEADVIGGGKAPAKIPASADGLKEQLKVVLENLSESRTVRLDPKHPVLTGGHRLRVQLQLQILVVEDKAFGPETTPEKHVAALEATLAEANELGVTKATCPAREPCEAILSYHLGRRELNNQMSRVQAQRSEFYENTGKDETSEAHLLKLHQLVEQVNTAQKACSITGICEEVTRSEALCTMIEEEERILATIEAATMKRNLAELSHTLLIVDKLVKQGDGYIRDRAEVMEARELQKELLSVYHNEEVVLQGFLQKEGEKNKSMKKRFFVLQAGLLKYFDKEGGKEKGEINMLDVYVVKHDTNGANAKKFNIELKNIKRIFTLQADSSEEAQNWCDMIRNCALAANLLHTENSDDMAANALPGPNLDRETEVRSVSILQMLEDLKVGCKAVGLEPGEKGGGGIFRGEIHRGRLTAGNILVKDDLEHIDLLYRFTETMHLMVVLCIRDGEEGKDAAMFCFEDDACTNYTGVLRLTPDSKCNIAGIADHAMQVVTPWCLVFWVASNEDHMEVWYAKIRETLDALNKDLIARQFQSVGLGHIPAEVLVKAKKAAVDARTYEVTFKEKMMLGFKVKPKGDNWALVSDSNPGNGIAKGSVLMGVNDRAVLKEGLYAVYEKELKEWTPPIVFKFRQPASGGGALYTTRGGKWKRQYSFLESGVMRFFRIEGASPVELESFFNLEGSCVRPIDKTSPIAHSRDHCFVLMGSCGQLVCQCHDNEDRNVWVATLYYAIAMANGATFVEAAVQEDENKRRTVTSEGESETRSDAAAQREHEERAIKCIAADGGRPAQVKEGWLNKRSIGNRVMHNWKKRFFRLSYYGKLVYYVGDEESLPSKGSIVMTWDMMLEESAMKKNCIAIKSKDTEVFLQADSTEEMASWMAALRKVIDISTSSSDYTKTRFVT
jgi:hypothetical protein